MSELVKIETYFNVMEAQIAKSKLEAFGVYCFLQDENLVQTDWLRTIAYGGIKLFVREEDATYALELLQNNSENEDEQSGEN